MDQQLFGTIEGDSFTGRTMLCIDADRPNEAAIHWWDPINPGAPPSAAAVCEMRRSSSGRLDFLPKLLYRLDKGFGLYLPRLTSAESDSFKKATLFLEPDGEGFKGEATVATGERFLVSFGEVLAAARVKAVTCQSWDEFKTWATISRDRDDAAAFRGHGSNAWGLISTLHRAGRYRLERYCGETLLQFRGHAEAVSGQRFDLSNPEDYALLLGLAQHHGLPTPMLDWTGSPYIAAFFAFADALENSRKPGEHVRIYGLVRQYLQAASPGMVTLPYVANYVCALSISPRNNPRLYAQQGQFLVTNMGDLESYLRAVEHATGQQILIAADIPVECASIAMADLAYMGLTAATLFPGLDGVCRMLRHEMRYSHRSVPPAGKPADMSPMPQSPVVNEIQTDAAQPLQGNAAATSI